jgi:hypothetical protein
MINIVELIADLFTFGIYSGYKNQKIIEERTKKYEEERMKNKRFLSKSYNF